MQNVFSSHTKAVLQALLVTFLWSTSYVLVKVGLADIPALTFAGLRYTIAFVVLLPFALRKRQYEQMRTLPRTLWLRLILLGILFYSITQGSNFWALVYLPAATTSLLFNFTPVIVAFLSAVLLNEPTRINQMIGVTIFISGSIVYFYPMQIPFQEILGLTIAFVGVLANGLSSVLGRHINRDSGLDPSVVTVISMGIGAAVLLVVGLLVQGLPSLNWRHWAIILWLAVVNSAFAFTLWNHTLRSLSATESSVINNTMLVQIAVLAWIFLGEQLDTRELIGLVLATVGVMVFQLSRRRGLDHPEDEPGFKPTS
jgi:drug/metabolite transporter (DMT)-like permease